MPKLLKRGEYADDEESDVEDGDGENNIEESLPPDIKGDPEDYLEDLYNDMGAQVDNYEMDNIVDHHFKDGILILKARYYMESKDSKYV
eukprot:6266770-Ditylum_brightwellii.AAC.1